MSGPIGASEPAGLNVWQPPQPLAIHTCNPSRVGFAGTFAEPPPAKAAIVIAAPAQARPPAARVVALTPPAAGVRRGAGRATAGSRAQRPAARCLGTQAI